MADFTNTTPPSISGNRVVGGTLTANPGTWVPTPASYTYIWERGDDINGLNRETIPGATGGTYTVDPTDTTKFLRVGVYPVAPAGVAPSLLGRWYSVDSAFNAPIPEGVAIHANSSAIISAMVAQQTTTGSSPWGPTISSVPTVGISTGLETEQRVRDNHPTCFNTSIQTRFPTGFVVEEEFESKAVILYPDGTEDNFYKLTPPGVATLSSSGGPAAGACTDPTDWGSNIALKSLNCWTGKGYPIVGGRASRTSGGAGLMRFRDLRTAPLGTWDHALALSHAKTSNGSTNPLYVAPASGGDGTTAGSGAMPMGARLQLDPAINTFTWPSLTSEYQRQLARTLQVYGAIVIDTTGSGSPGSLIAEYQCTASHRGGSNLFNGINGFSWAGTGYLLPQDLTSHFRVVDWNVWTGA